MGFEDAYKKVAAKYKLPEFDVLDREVDLSGCESEHHPLQHVRGRVADKINFWLELLETVLSPDPARTSSLHETRFFTDAERNAVFTLYKKLMGMDRSLIEAAVMSDEKHDAAVIKDIWSQWEGLKIEMLVIVKQMKDSWQKEIKMDENLGYLG